MLDACSCKVLALIGNFVFARQILDDLSPDFPFYLLPMLYGIPSGSALKHCGRNRRVVFYDSVVTHTFSRIILASLFFSDVNLASWRLN